MSKRGKRYLALLEKVDKSEFYSVDQALDLVKEIATAKFDETVEAHIRLNVDPRKSDQNVRGTVILPHGTGKTPKVVAIVKADKIELAKQAGADYAGSDDIIAKIKGGWSDFDIVVATPDMMSKVGSQLGRILGPRMPNPKAGTLSPKIDQVIKEIKSGKVQFKLDKTAIIHIPIGKVSYPKDKLKENLAVLLSAIIKARPAAAKGQFIKSLYLSPTMGPGVKISVQDAMDLAKSYSI